MGGRGRPGMSGVEEPGSRSKRGRPRLGSGSPKQTLRPSKPSRLEAHWLRGPPSASPLSQSNNRLFRHCF